MLCDRSMIQLPEQSIHSGLFRSNLISILVTALPLCLLVVFLMWSGYQDEISHIEKQVREEAMQTLRSRVDDAVSYADFMAGNIDERTRLDVRERVQAAHALATGLFQKFSDSLPRPALEKMILEALRPLRFDDGQGYYFATRLDGIELLFADHPELEGKSMLEVKDNSGRPVIVDMIALARSQGEGFYEYVWTKPDVPGSDHRKISYIKYFEPYDMFIGTGLYVEDVEAMIKKEVLSRIETMRWGQDEYLFVFQYDGLYLSHLQKKYIGQNLLTLRDPNGIPINEELVRICKSGGGFLDYQWDKYSTGTLVPKLSFAKGLSKWEWVIGTGLYLEDIEARQAAVRKALREKTLVSVGGFSFLVIFSILCSYLYSRRFQKMLQHEIQPILHFLNSKPDQRTKLAAKDQNFVEFWNIAEAALKLDTLWRESQENLLEKENMQRLLLENTQQGIYGLDKAGNCTFANAACIHMLGYRNEGEIVGNYTHFLIKTSCPSENCVICKAIAAGTPIHEESEVMWRKDGTQIPVELWSHPIVDKGVAAGGVVTFFDISERKKAEAEVRRSESRLRRLVDILQHPSKTIQELFDYALDQAIQLTESKIGYIYHYHEDRKEFVLNSWSKEVLPACTVRKPQTCYELAKTGLWGEAVRQRKPIIVNDYQAAHPLKKGYPDRHVQLLKFVTVPIFKGDQIVSVVGLANKETDYEQTDILQISLLMEAVWKIAENMQAEEDRKKLQVHLQQAQKMEAIGTLAGGIAHDFNNILGAILGYAEMIQEDSPAGSRTRSDIDQVVMASHRAKELVKQILNFSRQAATEQIPLQPALIIMEVVKMLRSSLPSTIDLQQDVDPDAGLILADPTQIHQLLVNLCTNAFHAMEETGGTLAISLKKTTLSMEDLASEPQIQPGDFLQLSVGDTGSGIAPEIQEKMFDPFFTTKEVGKGTGMGLAIIHGIVKSYKGFVTCHSQPGEGSVFHVYLPVLQDPVVLERQPVPLDLSQFGNERILFIDDEEILADMGKAILERLGYRVTVKRNSIEALNTFQNQPNQFDLVITDQTMPGMTGSDLARRMLQIRPGMPIILCTGYSSVMSEEKARLMGIKGFAMKPLARKDIGALIRKILDEEKPIN
jgi:PAS domain S-box-containing protein